MFLLKTMSNTILHAKNLAPTSLMDNFCRALHPNLDLSSTCYTWFKQAVDHCAELVLRQQHSPYFWTALQSFIFPSRETSLLNQKIPISIHPTRLSASDCEAFFFDIVNDYVAHAPAYAPEAITNTLLWQLIYSLLSVLSLGLLMVFTILSYRNFVKSLEKPDLPKYAVPEEDKIFLYEKYNTAFINRKSHQAKCMRDLMQPKLVSSPDGIPTASLNVPSKLNFVDGIVASTDVCSEGLHRLQDLNSQFDYKTETIANMMRFMSNDTRKLELLVFSDDDPIYEEMLRRHSPKISTRFSSLPNRKLSSPRIPTNSNKSVYPNNSLVNKVISPRLPTQIPKLSWRTSNTPPKK